ncbi:hypothetical protein Vretimale_10574 [Volvox reticuliferus]|uniref:Uncharacterized protein n=1 Tax=Volvox reticuliferus TaxID=1737510 RepID=A0A8J4FR44_9CHLO|nr:hypothetical protein Vretifemale_12535 [Volvox reticuliferus]GIM06181.1 hypothetical protein Vretimale_10574 [Volvox reticuliferus]
MAVVVPRHLEELVMREPHGRGRRDGRKLGVSSDLERQGRSHKFQIMYEDGEIEEVGLPELHARLASTTLGKKAARSTAVQQGASADWALEGVRAVEAALGQGMPGWHSRTKVVALHTALTRPDLVQYQPSTVELGDLLSILMLEKTRRVFLPFGWTEELRAILLEAGCSVRQLLSTGIRESVGPGALASRGMPCADAVVFGSSSKLLDLILPSVVEQDGIVTAARVPIEYITMGDEARVKWLRARQDEGRMVLCRSGRCLWVVIFTTVFWKDGLFRGAGDTFEMLKV